MLLKLCQRPGKESMRHLRIPNRNKKHKVLEEQIQIQQENRQITQSYPNSNSFKGFVEENKFTKQNDHWDSSKIQNKANLKQKHSKIQLKIKEENKENLCIDEDSKVLMPFEIKKLIESTSKQRNNILDMISFPYGKNSTKILQNLKEISLLSIKKIQIWFQRIKATERKLKDVEVKTHQSLEKKDVGLDILKSSSKRMRSSRPNLKAKEKTHTQSRVADLNCRSSFSKINQNTEYLRNRNDFISCYDVDFESKEDESRFANRNSREEIIEYNPDELSEEDSDPSSEIGNQYMMLNQNSHQNYLAPDKDLMVWGKSIPIYEWKNWGK